MTRWITKREILNLIDGKDFKTEDEFRDYLVPLLAKLFKVKESQVSTETETTSFDSTLSNRADIVIRTDDNFRKALVVFELKLTKSVERYNGGDYEVARKQLHKYCQDTRAPYGILLTELSCAIYKNKYFSYNQVPKRDFADRVPCIDKIEDRMALYTLLDFILYKNSTKYLFWMFFIIASHSLIVKSLTQNYGMFVSSLYSFIVGLIIVIVMVVFALVFKIFE